MVKNSQRKIRYGQIIRLRHLGNGALLKSLNRDYTHPGNSSQQMVVCSKIRDDFTLWKIKGPRGSDLDKLKDDVVQDKATIRLEHVETRKNLHTHNDRPAPLTPTQHEVTCYQIEENGDDNDHWIILLSKGDEWLTGETFRLRSATTNDFLHSHLGPVSLEFTNGEYEATAAEDDDSNSDWRCKESDQPNRPQERFSLGKYLSVGLMKKELFWIAVGSIATIVAATVGIYTLFFMHQEASKGLEATLLSRSQLLNPDVHGPKELTLQYKGQDIPDVGILQVRFRSSGKQPILKSDIVEPIRITVSGMEQIISASIVSEEPHDLNVVTNFKGPVVELNTPLLNPNDWFTVEIDGVTQFGNRVDVYTIDGRVAGVERIAFLRSVPESKKQSISWQVLVLLIALGVGTGAFGYSALLSPLSPWRRR
jgi:hypothetical protein